MTFRELKIAVRKALLELQKDYGLKSVPVIDADQMKKQGRVETGIYYRVLDPKNHGWQGRSYNIQGKDAGHVESQHYEVMFQFSVVSSESNTEAIDIAAETQMIASSLPFVDKLLKMGIGVQRPTAIRTLGFINEQDNYDIEASFDVNVTFNRSINPKTSVITLLEGVPQNL